MIAHSYYSLLFHYSKQRSTNSKNSGREDEERPRCCKPGFLHKTPFSLLALFLAFTMVIPPPVIMPMDQAQACRLICTWGENEAGACREDPNDPSCGQTLLVRSHLECAEGWQEVLTTSDGIHVQGECRDPAIPYKAYSITPGGVPRIVQFPSLPYPPPNS